MSDLKKIIKQFVPPVLLSGLKPLLNKKHSDNTFKGNFSDWKEALKNCDGYDKPSILNKITEASLKVKNGLAVYERDSVLFDKVEYSWQLLCGLFYAAAHHSNNLSVLDFGGSLGTSYYQNKNLLSAMNSLEWSIVEQPHFVKSGKELFEDDILKFYNSIDECLRSRKPNVIVISSVLQYLEDPISLINKIVDSGINHVIVDKTLFISGHADRIMVQRVPENIYKASYPVRFFNYSKLLACFQPTFKIIAEFDAYNGLEIEIDKQKARYKGFILERK